MSNRSLLIVAAVVAAVLAAGIFMHSPLMRASHGSLTLHSGR